MISLKTNSAPILVAGKLPVPGPKSTQAATRFADKPARSPASPGSANAAAVEAGKVMGDVPKFLDAKKTPTAKQSAAAEKTTIAWRARCRITEKLAAKVKDPVKKAAIEKVAAVKETKHAAKTAPTASKSGSKIDLVAKLLKRASGCTTADILDATGWKAVNVPRQAELAGLKLTKKRDEKAGVTRYFGK